MPVVKALPCGKVGLFVASTLVLLHRVAAGKALELVDRLCQKSLKLEAGPSRGPFRPPLPLARVSFPTQEHPQRSTTMEGILP